VFLFSKKKILYFRILCIIYHNYFILPCLFNITSSHSWLEIFKVTPLQKLQIQINSKCCLSFSHIVLHVNDSFTWEGKLVLFICCLSQDLQANCLSPELIFSCLITVVFCGEILISHSFISQRVSLLNEFFYSHMGLKTDFCKYCISNSHFPWFCVVVPILVVKDFRHVLQVSLEAVSRPFDMEYKIAFHGEFLMACLAGKYPWFVGKVMVFQS